MNEDAERELPFVIAEVEKFEQNLVWKEIIRTVQERMTINEAELLTEVDLNKILRAQGDMIACQFFFIQTELIKRDLELKKQTEESENG